MKNAPFSFMDNRDFVGREEANMVYQLLYSSFRDYGRAKIVTTVTGTTVHYLYKKRRHCYIPCILTVFEIREILNDVRGKLKGTVSL